MNQPTTRGDESVLEAAFAGKYDNKINDAIRKHVAETVNNSLSSRVEAAENSAVYFASQKPCPFFASPIGCRLGNARPLRHELPEQQHVPPPALPPSSSTVQQPLGPLTPLAAMGLSDAEQPPLLLERGLLKMAPEAQRRLLGERLFALVYSEQPGLAAKITGMFIESSSLTTAELLALVEDKHLYQQLT